MDAQPIVFKNPEVWINLFVGGELFPVQLRTLLHGENNGTWFKDRIVMCVQWDTSINHIKYRMDVDRDPVVFRHVLQYMRNGKKVALPAEKWQLQEILCEAVFFGMEGLAHLVRKKLWRLTGKANYFACYSDDSD